MQKEFLIRELVDFFERRNKFERINEYVGMASSQRPRLFVEFYNSLNPEAKEDMAKIILEGTVGKLEGLNYYIPQTLHLMLVLCLQKNSSSFLKGLKIIEDEFNDPENREYWIKSEDVNELPVDLSFKKDWHYALMLWNILKILGSSNAISTYNYLISNVKSKQFKNALMGS